MLGCIVFPLCSDVLFSFSRNQLCEGSVNNVINLDYNCVDCHICEELNWLCCQLVVYQEFVIKIIIATCEQLFVVNKCYLLDGFFNFSCSVFK